MILPKPLTLTKRGENWLKNFAPCDQEAAKRLLATVEVIDETEFRQELRAMIEEFQARHQGKTIGWFVVQQLPTGEPRSAFYTSSQDLGSDDGSGLIVENILHKTKLEGKGLISPSGEEMRKERLDFLVFVTDTVGSGGEASKIIEFVTNNPSVKSWISGKFLQVALITHSISSDAYARLKRIKRLHLIEYVQASLGFEASGWSLDERAEIEELCKTYADVKKLAFGYGKTVSLTIYQHTVSNGLPRILLQSKSPVKGGKWRALFPNGRSGGLLPEDEKISSGYSPDWSAAETIHSIQAGSIRRLQKRERLAVDKAYAHAFRPVVVLLVCIRAGVTPRWRQLKFTRMSEARWAEVCDYAIQMGFLSPNLEITRAGKSIIKKFGKKKALEAASLPTAEDDLYYPQSLR